MIKFIKEFENSLFYAAIGTILLIIFTSNYSHEYNAWQSVATGSNATKYVPTTTVTAASQGIVYDNYGVDNAATLLQILRDIDSGTFDGVTFESGRVVNFETTVEMAYSFANTNLNSVANGLLTTDGSDRVTFYTDNNICQILTNVPGTGFQNFTFENIKFEHGGSTLSGCGNNNNDASLISLNHSDNGGSYNIYFDNCEFTAPNVYMDGASGFSQAIGGIRDITFKDCYFHDTGRMLFEFFGQRAGDLGSYNPATDANIQRLTISGGDYVRGGLIGELGISIVQSVYDVLIEDIDVADSGAMLEVGVTYAYFDDIRATGSGDVFWIGGIYNDYNSPLFIQGDYVINNLQADISGGIDMFGGVQDIVIQNSTIETDQSWWTLNTYGTMEINNSNLILGNNTTNMIRQEQNKANWSITNTEITKSTNAGIWDDRSVVSMECTNIMLDGSESFTSSGYSSLTDVQVFNSGVAGTEYGDTAQDCGTIGYTTPSNPTPTCSDGIQNGDETGIDCGGSCSPCTTPEPNNYNLADVSGPLKAFPLAYGGGSQVTGGRGFPVQIVTNLNASGSGSFDQALINANSNGGGTIVFYVSGTIDYGGTTKVYSNLQNITIAGQTAPAGGITLTDPVSFQDCNNFIVRYIRGRISFETNADVINYRWSQNAIFDHLSLSYAGDELLDVSGRFGTYDPQNITVQYCLAGNSLRGMLIGDSNTPSNSANLSVNRNLFANASHRFPNINGVNGETINNVVFNWNARLKAPTGDSEAIAINLNDIGNYYKLGAYTPFNGRRNRIYNYSGYTYEPALSIYVDGNYLEGTGIVGQDSWENWNGTAAASGFFTNTQFSLIGDAIPILTYQQAYNDLLANAGNAKRINQYGFIEDNRDAVDQEIITEITNNTPYDYEGNGHTSKQSYVNFQNSVSTTPISQHPAGYDTDADGLPDGWEQERFGSLSATATGDHDGDGYTNIEEFIYLIDVAEQTNPTSPVTNSIMPTIQGLLIH